LQVRARSGVIASPQQPAAHDSIAGPTPALEGIVAKPRPGVTLAPDAVASDRTTASVVVWAPYADSVELCVVENPQPEPSRLPEERITRAIPLDRFGSDPSRSRSRGWFCTSVPDLHAGDLYRFRLKTPQGAVLRPDPASRYQPYGVHGPSAVVDTRFDWRDRDWIEDPRGQLAGLTLADFVIYELHVGTFTREGTFVAAAAQLDRLRELGITAVEIMPVAQFPGARNWGYDGVDLYAVQNSYGGPAGLQKFVDACHARRMAVLLDVVYNHLGPEGNYLASFGPYFTGRYRTPWGEALNYDGPDSDDVRQFFIQNAIYWLDEFHMDGLRLDAIHGIVDSSAHPFLAELADAVHRFAAEKRRHLAVIAESDLNDVRVLQSRAEGGFGMDAQWNDDFHHALHTVLTEERAGYYGDFGKVADLASAIERNFVYSGRHSQYRRRRHGNDASGYEPSRFVVFAQNHDQVGNRRSGDRLGTLLDFEQLKLAASAVLLSPFIPLLFMGEEYGEIAPFLYFVSHSDRELIEAVRRGRREEFRRFDWQGEIPDAQAGETFRRCILDDTRALGGHHKALHDFHAELLRLRRSLPADTRVSRANFALEFSERDRWLAYTRGGEAGKTRASEDPAILIGLNFSSRPAEIALPPGRNARNKGNFRLALDSADVRWGGPGSRAAEHLAAGRSDTVAAAPWSALAYISEAG
jgi:maltooligosyltrehalose trehalohydrolase